MSKDEVAGFLQYVKYMEVLPLNEENGRYKKEIKYCLGEGLLNITPDRLCILSEKARDLLEGKFEGTKRMSLLDEELLRKDQSVKSSYWLAGAAICCVLVYELLIKGV
jgi:hypothetical protein